MAMDPNKKRLVKDDEFVTVNVRIDPPQPGKTGAFSARKHRYYTQSGLEGGFASRTPRIQYLIDKIAEIAEETGDVVPYAFVDRDENRWSIDAGCLDAIGPKYQNLVKFVVDDGYIIGVRPLPKDNFVSIVTSSDPVSQDLEEIVSDKRLSNTIRLALIAARVGQGEFRRQVLDRWGGGCAVTGCRLLEALRASHILPWRDSDNRQRLDPENGLPLVATLDALFDRGLISFGSTGRLLTKRKLRKDLHHLLGHSRLSRMPTTRTANYLAEHRKAHGFRDLL